MDGVEVCFRIGEARGFAHLFYSLLPISNIKSGDLIHFPVSEKRNDFGVKNISLGVHCGVADMVLPVIEVQLHKAGKSHVTALGFLQMEFALPLLRFTFGFEAALTLLLSFPGEISVAKLAVPCACFFVLIAGH